MINFEVGDVVKLKSGGVAMVVESTVDASDYSEVSCVWHDVRGTPHEATYYAASLVKQSQEVSAG